MVDGVSLLKAASLIGKYASGHGREAPEHIRFFRGTEVEIELEKPDSVNVDGEELIADRIRFRLVPGAARLIVPAGMHFFDDKKPPEKAEGGASQKI